MRGTKKAQKRIKEKPQKVDGFGPIEVKRIRSAIRKVWSWSYARKLCIERATDKAGFAKCEGCKKRVPKIFPDHIEAAGDVDEGYMARMFVPSKMLQALCRKCHNAKTNQERADRRRFDEEMDK